MKNIFKNRKFSKGFMMTEAVLAIFIAGTILVVFVAVMASTLRAGFNSRDYVLASNLAQEGIEIVRNIRDNNWAEAVLESEEPLTAFEDPFPENGDWCFNFGSNDKESTKESRSRIGCTVDFPDSVPLKPGRFKRLITISDSDGDSKKVESKVSWTPVGAVSPISVTISDTLYPWADK